MSGDGAPFRAAGGCTGAGSSRGVRLTLLASNHQELLAEELPNGGELQIKRHQDSRESVSDSPWCTVGIDRCTLRRWVSLCGGHDGHLQVVSGEGVCGWGSGADFGHYVPHGSPGAMIAFLVMVLSVCLAD